MIFHSFWSSNNYWTWIGFLKRFEMPKKSDYELPSEAEEDNEIEEEEEEEEPPGIDLGMRSFVNSNKLTVERKYGWWS